MKKDIKVSIVVPVYNTAKYLNRCLNSLINQTLKNIEIICVDDGSEDNSLDVLYNFRDLDNRIKVFTQNNKKQGAARNRGINAAEGEYIGFVDSDDYVQNDFFEKLYSAAKQNNADITCTNIVRQRGNYNKYRLLYKDNIKANSIDEKLKICTSIGGDYCWNVWNKLYKKEFLVSNDIYFDENVYFEDVYFTIRAIYLSNLITAVSDTNYYYCARPDSVVKGKQDKKKFEDLLSAYTKLYSYCLDNNIKISKKNSYCTKIYLKIFSFIILSSKIKFENKWLLCDFKLFNFISIFRQRKINPHMCYSYPVDIVYTWCDDKDENFKKERDFWKQKLGVTTSDSNFECQWDENEELKYSIRSIEKYAPWIRNIYIITNSQTPKWLKVSDRIKIIDIKDIMPKDCIPVFNSQAIETCLPYINGLSEHFLYSCDDMFFNQPVSKSFFFNEDGKPIVRLQGKISKKTYDKSLYARTIVSAQNKVKDLLGVKIENSPHHCIDSYTKTCFIECLKDFKADFERTCYQKFRSEDSVQRAIILYHALAKGNAVLRLTKLFNLFTRDSKCISMNHPKKLRYLKNKSIKLFCINDDSNASIQNKQLVKQFLENKFNTKCSYEL